MDIPISISGDKSIPKPFNENDVTVWTALICKFLCQKKYYAFALSKFLTDVLEDRILPINAYNKEMIRSAKSGGRNEFYQITIYCLEFLRRNKLLELRKDSNSNGQGYSKYYPTERLRSICPQIRRVLMPAIKPVLDAEREIRKGGSHHDCFALLEYLEKFRNIKKTNAAKFVNIHQFNKLVQLGVVTLYLDGKISITTFGQLLIDGQRIPPIDVTLMLLEPRKRLALRRKVKRALTKSGYPKDNVVIMEDIKDNKDFIYNKFGRILKQYAPKLFFSFFHENVSMDGVIFELGWLCGMYSRQEINERLRIISTLNYNWMHTARYIQSLFLAAQLLPLEKMNTRLISKCISNNVQDSLEKYHKKLQLELRKN